jgi:hypothetical protein
VATLLLECLTRERALYPTYARDSTIARQSPVRGYWRQLQEREEKFFDLVTPVFAQGIAAGQFIAANPRLLAFMLRGMVRSIGYYQIIEGQETVTDALPLLLTLLSSGLTPKSPAAAEVET